jgi:hypothetical protein
MVQVPPATISPARRGPHPEHLGSASANVADKAARESGHSGMVKNDSGNRGETAPERFRRLGPPCITILVYH